MNNIKICALQLGTLSISDSRLEYYLSLANEHGVKIVVLGEYVVNSFFNELTKMPKSAIKAQSEQKKKSLSEFAKKYNLTIIAPVVISKGKDLLKVVIKFTPTTKKSKTQNILMPYSHWNENAFFQNDQNIDIMSFSQDGFKFGVIFGFEAHFDTFWQEIRNKKLDCVLIPTACALNSQKRWVELLKMRAFTNNVFVLRINRLGKTKFDKVETEFYGQSFLAGPNGNIINFLDEKEGMLICDIDKKMLSNARSTWKFRDIQSKINSN